MATPQQIDEIYETGLDGNHLALDFVNTVDWRLAPQRQDLLADHEVLLHWGRRLGLLTDEELRAALRSRRTASRGAAALGRAVDLRELLYDVFAATSHGRRAASSQLRALVAVFSEATAHAELERSDGAYLWSWRHSDPLERVRWAVAAAAVELLSSGAALGRVKQCRDEGCGWVFLDMSKNVSRRWCNMQGCGARAKMRRQYRRKKAERTSRNDRTTTT
jgi:predicted RNA-binding Zn ribbon-like protein